MAERSKAPDSILIDLIFHCAVEYQSLWGKSGIGSWVRIPLPTKFFFIISIVLWAFFTNFGQKKAEQMP